jgi:hypothetical protein
MTINWLPTLVILLPTPIPVGLQMLGDPVVGDQAAGVVAAIAASPPLPPLIPLPSEPCYRQSQHDQYDQEQYPPHCSPSPSPPTLGSSH